MLFICVFDMCSMLCILCFISLCGSGSMFYLGIVVFIGLVLCRISMLFLLMLSVGLLMWLVMVCMFLNIMVWL